MLAYQYLQDNHVDEAELAFLKAIQTDPREILNYRDLALLYMTEKNYTKAESEARTGLRLKANNTEIRSVLAEMYLQKGDKQSATRELRGILSIDPRNIYAYYTLAGLNSIPPNYSEEKSYLAKVLSFAPANIVPRLQLAEILAGNGKSDSALYYLQSVKKIAPDFSAAAAGFYNQAVTALHGNKSGSALVYIRQFHNLMKLTTVYAHGLDDVEGPKLPVGNPQFTTSQIANRYASSRKVSPRDVRFTDASRNVGINFGRGRATRSVIAVTDYSTTGEMYLYTSSVTGGNTDSHLLTGTIGSFQETRVTDGIKHEGEDIDAAFADYDNDGNQDLFITTTRGIIVYKNQGDGTFSRVRGDIGLRNTTDGRKMLFADFDQDGDLDLYVSQKGQNRFFRNNGDGTFTEQAAAMGLTGSPNGADNMDFADYDSDGDLDIVTVNDKTGLQLFNNNRHARFTDVTGSTRLKTTKYAGATVAFGDYNNDGLPDIFVAGNGSCTLLKNVSGTHFVPDAASAQLSSYLSNVQVNDAVFFDFDNDGHLDLLVAGTSNNPSVHGVQLFHNDTAKGFSNMTSQLPASVAQAYHIGLADFNTDGDDDIFLSGPSGAQLIRNDGGNLNHYMQVQLTGFSYGNSKNNRLGIGAQIELKSGDLYQLKTLKRPLANFGVGMRNSLDVVRIIWPNGVPQVIVDPSRNERIVEKEMLKGSCPFLFTWNGEKYEFIKDMMWRSALGMPLAVNGNDTTYAFADASKEYLLVPGEKLKPKNGKYTIKITEELWEAVYFDKVGLVAVDHPDSADTYVDERFVAPPFPGKTVYKVSGKYLPVSAEDGEGNNLLPKISSYDFQYASTFALGKYQGLAQDHDLVLDLGDKAKSDSLYLFLRGWVFPTDASINTALTQASQYQLRPPSLQVINSKGEWETVIPNLGFPMGRDKMVIANLSGKFLTPNDRRVRIRTDMQIYWDNIFFTTGNAGAPVKMNDLTMLDAKLGYHGYSATYRKGGPYGPEWLDYYDVSKGQKWRDLTGYYTRYGDVMPLLQRGDDEYIICNSGDEVTIDFDAQNLPPLPKGWKRDFLIYSEGWVKDGDLNTAYGQTVAPLPYHNMPSYPYNANFGYPTDKQHREYQEKYNTRKVSTGDFINALKPGK